MQYQKIKVEALKVVDYEAVHTKGVYKDSKKEWLRI